MLGKKPLSSISFLCFVLLTRVNSGPVTKCNANDNKCMKQSAQEFLPQFVAGIPEFGVQTLDPLKLKSVDASSPNLMLKINDMVVTGLKNCVTKKIERTETSLTTRFLCNVKAEGQYEMNGRLLVLPIQGKGVSKVVLNAIQIDVNNDVVTKTGKDGKKHWHIKGSSYTFQLKGKASVHFDNLFSGNELLAQAAQTVIENNGNEIVVEVGPPVIKAIVDKIIENINHLYRAVPAEQLTL